MAEKEQEDLCWCEDPFNVGKKLHQCGKAICLRLNNLEIPKLRIVKEPTIIIAEDEDD